MTDTDFGPFASAYQVMKSANASVASLFDTIAGAAGSLNTILTDTKTQTQQAMNEAYQAGLNGATVPPRTSTPDVQSDPLRTSTGITTTTITDSDGTTSMVAARRGA
jgi:DNA/RNA endonuclease YhcR with UshA esterase domain